MKSHSSQFCDLSPEELRRVGHAAVELMVEALAAEQADPVLPAVTGEDLRARFDGPPPPDGIPVEAVLAELREHLLPAHRKNGHPRFFGYVCASADPIGAIFDGLASFFNQNVTAWRSAPGATAMERLVVRWLDELVGFGGGGQGLLVSGGSAANATAIAMALRSAAGRSGASLADSLPRITAYVSTEGHLSLGKALRAFGVHEERVRAVECDERRRLRPEALDRRLAEDAALGLLPACVCATVGTVNTGVIDPLVAIAEVCERHGVWLHLDGAYGAPAAMTAEYAWLKEGIARADSLAIDPHKWLFAPLGTGCVLFRDAAAAQATFRLDSEYTTITGNDPIESFAFYDHGFEMSRRNRALNVWAILKTRGMRGIASAIERDIALRRRLDARIAAEPELEPLGSDLSITCFRWRPVGEQDDARLNAANRAILERLVGEGRFFLSPTTLEGRYALRVCIVNFRTRESDVDLLVDEVLRLSPGS